MRAAKRLAFCFGPEQLTARIPTASDESAYIIRSMTQKEYTYLTLNFFIAIRITYEELCINFLNILTQPKKFYRLFKKNS